MTKGMAAQTLGAKIVTFLASAFFGLVAAEGILRLVEGRDGTFRIADAYRHHALAPLQERTEAWGDRQATHSSNSLGMRDRARESVPPTNSAEKRILFLGDSFTEGLGIDYDQTFPAVVERELNSRSASEKTMRCFNAGLSSYSPLLELRALQQLWNQGYQFDEVVLLVDTSDPQDELLYRRELGLAIDRKSDRTELTDRPFYSEGQITLYRWSAIARKLWRTSRHFEPLWIWRDGKKEDREIWATDPELIARWGNQGVERLLESTEAIAHATRSRGVPLTVVIYPWPYQVEAPGPGILEDRVSRFCAAQDITFVNLYPTFRDHEDPQALFIDDDVHWNEKGHELVGSSIAQQLSAANALLATPELVGENRLASDTAIRAALGAGESNRE